MTFLKVVWSISIGRPTREFAFIRRLKMRKFTRRSREIGFHYLKGQCNAFIVDEILECWVEDDRCPENIFNSPCQGYCCGFEGGDQNLREFWSYIPNADCDSCQSKREMIFFVCKCKNSLWRFQSGIFPSSCSSFSQKSQKKNYHFSLFDQAIFLIYRDKMSADSVVAMDFLIFGTFWVKGTISERLEGFWKP